MANLANRNNLYSYPSSSLPRGFTFFEVLIVLAIVSCLASVGLFFSLQEYQRASHQAEVSKIKTVLERARSASLHGMDALPHGVAFMPLQYPGYVLFAGSSYVTSDVGSREWVPASVVLSFAVSSPEEVVFSSLSGTTSETMIVINAHEGISSSSFTINYEGLIY